MSESINFNGIKSDIKSKKIYQKNYFFLSLSPVLKIDDFNLLAFEWQTESVWLSLVFSSEF